MLEEKVDSIWYDAKIEGLRKQVSRLEEQMRFRSLRDERTIGNLRLEVKLLRVYARHLDGCTVFVNNVPCTCGLEGIKCLEAIR